MVVVVVVMATGSLRFLWLESKRPQACRLTAQKVSFAYVGDVLNDVHDCITKYSSVVFFLLFLSEFHFSVF